MRSKSSFAGQATNAENQWDLNKLDLPVVENLSEDWREKADNMIWILADFGNSNIFSSSHEFANTRNN